MATKPSDSQWFYENQHFQSKKSPLNKGFDCLFMYTFCNYNAFNVYCRELAPGTVSLTGDRAQGDDSKHWANSST